MTPPRSDQQDLQGEVERTPERKKMTAAASVDDERTHLLKKGDSGRYSASGRGSVSGKSIGGISVVSRRPSTLEEQAAMRRNSINVKTQTTFWQDALTFAGGSIPHSMVLAITIGAVCGIASWLYYAALWGTLGFVWRTVPRMFIVDVWPEQYYVLWIPLVAFVFALLVGMTVRFMGEPGDLPYTVKCVHEKAYLAMDHVMPMVCASYFSIVGGGSLGPEAPLVAICAALAGFISRSVFATTERNLIRKHTLMGMAAALAAFFGCPLGGSMFAMEVNSRFGVEYFEHTIEAIFCGEVSLFVFRTVAGLPIDAIWNITEEKLETGRKQDIIYGALMGLLGALISWIFAHFHWSVMRVFEKFDLLKHENAIPRAMAGCVVVVITGMLVPHTMFWGEYEFQTVATQSPANTLEHVFPTSGLIGFEVTGLWNPMIMGVTKLVAISLSVCGGYRGGYIFPAFLAGAGFGLSINYLCPFIPVQVCILCMGAAINVSLTRTAIGTTLILAYLSGDQCSVSSILASSLVALFATGYMPFIKSQMTRSDLDESLYYSDDYPMSSLEQQAADLVAHLDNDEDHTNSENNNVNQNQEEDDLKKNGAVVNIVV